MRRDVKWMDVKRGYGVTRKRGYVLLGLDDSNSKRT